MTDLKESLRPCPFCGSAEHEADRVCLKTIPDSQNYYSVVCWCGTSGPIKESEREAIKAWNARDYADRQAVWNPFNSSKNVVALDFKGNLKSIGLPTILQILSSDNKTGILQFTNGHKRRAICLKEGKIIQEADNQAFSWDKSSEALLQVLDKAKKAGKRVGEMLLALGYLSWHAVIIHLILTIIASPFH